MKIFLKISTPEHREAVAKAVGSSLNYFFQIAGGHKKPSHKLCHRLVDADPRFDLTKLRPDIWKPTDTV